MSESSISLHVNADNNDEDDLVAPENSNGATQTDEINDNNQTPPALIIADTIDLHVKANSNENDEIELIDIQLEVSDKDRTENINTQPIKNSKCMYVLYITFVIFFCAASIIQFGGFSSSINILLYVNLIGGLILLFWVIFQFHDGPLKYIWLKRQLYLPLLFHIVDTSSDLGTTYIYFQTYKESLQEEADGEKSEPGPETHFQLFVTSIFIILSYRILSSLLIFIFTNKTERWRSAFLQFLDLYIFDVLIKSWKYNKIKATSIQILIQSVEAYYESFPQLLMNALFIIEFVLYQESEADNTNLANVLFVAVSGLFSLMSVANKAVAEDKKYFKYDGNIRDIELNYKCKNKCPFNPKYIIHAIYRYCDVFFRIYVLMVLWDSPRIISFIGNGYIAISIILFDFIAGTLICWIETKHIDFELMGCIAVTPLVSKRRISSIIAFIWRLLQNVFFLVYIIIPEFDWDDFLPDMAVVCWIFVTIVSLIYFMETIFNLRCCCNVMKEYGTNARSFAGIERVEDLKELVQFGYVCKANHIKYGDFSMMQGIKKVYVETMKLKNDDKEFKNAWKNVKHLLHQICKNNTMKDENEIKELLDLVIHTLQYDVNALDDKSLTALMIAIKHQNNDKIIKLLISEYNINTKAVDGNNRSVIFYVEKYWKLNNKPDIIEMIKQASTD